MDWKTSKTIRINICMLCTVNDCMLIIIKLSLQTLGIQADCLRNANNITKY